MNAWMLHALADSRRQEMVRDAAGPRGGFPAAAGSPGPRWPRMRRHVGYALVEAGLRLLATAGPSARG